MDSWGKLQSAHSRPAIGFAFVCLLLLCAWIEWPALSGPFLFDDFPNLKHLEGLGGRINWASLADYMRQYGGAPGRPLAMLSFTINDFSWPSEPWAFKYTNLMIHLLVGSLVFGFVRSAAGFRTTSLRADTTALIAAAAWLLHPMQLSTSMLVVQRMAQLSMLFSMAGLWAYLAVARRAARASVAVAGIAVLGLGTIFATLCKETGALVPLLAVVTNVTLLRDHLRALPQASRRILHAGTILPALGMWLVIIRRWESATDFSNRDFTMWERVLSETRALVDYLHQVLIPSLRGGGIYHDDFVVSRGILQPWTTLPSLLLIVVLIVSALALHRKRPMFAFAVLWFFAGHLLESSIFPLELYFEHRNYLPMLGPLFALAYCSATAAPRWQKLATVTTIFWLLFATFLTWVQAPIWGDIRKLTGVWAIEHPGSARAVAQRAQFYFSVGASDEAAEALLQAYSRGVRGDSFPLQALNTTCLSRNRTIASRAKKLAVKELGSGRYNRATLETMGKLRRQLQNNACSGIIDQEEWLGLTDLLLANPAYQDGGTLNYIYVERAYLFQYRKDLDGTMREFEAAWNASPSPKLAQLIAATLASAGLYREALNWTDLALKNRITGFQGMLSNDEEVTLKLREVLRRAARNQQQNQPGGN